MRLIIICLLLLSGCNIAELETALPDNPIIESGNEWDLLAEGYESRTLRTETNFLIRAIRINPNLFAFRAHYNTSTPLNIDQWQATLPTAEAIINANFFGTQNEVLGLLISDGAVFGQSYGRGGTFVVQNGMPRVRYTPNEPYYAGEPIEQAVQAFPMLVLNGQQAYTNTNDFAPSRRTAIGQDSQGRILIFVTLSFGLSLPQFSAYLANEASLDLVNAFNLDGGGSTMLYSAPNDFRLRSIDPVPTVLAIYPR